MLDTAFDFLSIIWLDMVLSGDNALVIGLAAASLPSRQRRSAIVFGLVAAAVIRIGFACMATYLMSVPGLLFVGGLALLWVSYRLYVEIRGDVAGHASAMTGEDGGAGIGGRTLFSALISITIADISMSIDNVLAVAAIARDDRVLLVFGLVLSIAFMGLCATMILKVLVRYRWISYLGVAFLVMIGSEMMWDGWISAAGLVGIELASASPVALMTGL